MAVAEVAAEGEVEGGHGLERDTAIYRDVIAVKETGRAGSWRSDEAWRQGGEEAWRQGGEAWRQGGEEAWRQGERRPGGRGERKREVRFCGGEGV